MFIQSGALRRLQLGEKMVDVLQWEIEGLHSLISMLGCSDPYYIKLMGFLAFCRNFAF